RPDQSPGDALRRVLRRATPGSGGHGSACARAGTERCAKSVSTLQIPIADKAPERRHESSTGVACCHETTKLTVTGDAGPPVPLPRRREPGTRWSHRRILAATLLFAWN